MAASMFTCPCHSVHASSPDTPFFKGPVLLDSGPTPAGPCLQGPRSSLTPHPEVREARAPTREFGGDAFQPMTATECLVSLVRCPWLRRKPTAVSSAGHCPRPWAGGEKPVSQTRLSVGGAQLPGGRPLLSLFLDLAPGTAPSTQEAWVVMLARTLTGVRQGKSSVGLLPWGGCLSTMLPKTHRHQRPSGVRPRRGIVRGHEKEGGADK